MKEPQQLVLLTFETKHYVFQAVGENAERAREALDEMWVEWCRATHADPDLISAYSDDIQTMVLTAGATFVDHEPFPPAIEPSPRELAMAEGTVLGQFEEHEPECDFAAARSATCTCGEPV